jgi:hypothetical protein
MLAPSLAASWKTTHRFTLSRSDSAYGRRELSLGRSADPRRIAEARNHHFRTYRLALSRGRPTTRSQTWRTFFANQLGGQTFVSPVMFADAHDEDVVVDASALSFRPVPSIDASGASIHGPIVDWERSLQPSSLGVGFGHHHLQNCTGAHKSSGRDPPRHLRLLRLQPASRRPRRRSLVRARQYLRDRRQSEINFPART